MGQDEYKHIQGEKQSKVQANYTIAMELYLEPAFLKKDSRFKKGHTPWNKGRKDWTTKDPEIRERMKKQMEMNRRNMKSYKRRIVNRKPTVVYTLDGIWIGVYPSITQAARSVGVNERNARYCVQGKRNHVSGYRFRLAEIIDFNGEKIVKRENIGPLKKKYARTKPLISKKNEERITKNKNPELLESR